MRSEAPDPDSVQTDHTLDFMRRLAPKTTLLVAHETNKPVQDEDFKCDNRTPYGLVKYFLEDNKFWAAENMLQICFRSVNKNHVIQLKQIWKSASWFLTANDKAISRDVLLAKIAMWQTFCEGLLHRQLAHLDIGSDEDAPWSWMTSMQALDKAISGLAAEKDIATSRIVARTQLVKFDKKLTAGCAQIDAGPGVQDLQLLYTLLEYAVKNDDYQLQHGLQWRINVLVHDKQPTRIAIPYGLVPHKTYQRFWTVVNQAVHTPARTKWQDIQRAAASELWDTPQVLQASHAKRASILLVGHTGTGKSTLFRAITNKYAATSNGYRPTTEAIQPGECRWTDGTMVECIDTPGFGDTTWSDYQGLEKLAEFLEHRHKSGATLSSVFYLISLASKRIDSSALRQAKALKALIGDVAWSNMVFIFTHAVAANMMPGPLRKRAEADDKALMLRWETEIFPEAKERGAKFIELELDVTDLNKMELVERANSEIGAEGDVSDSDKHGSSSSDRDSETAHDSEAADDKDASTSRSNVFRGVQHEKVDRWVSWVISRPNPITLRCQYEICEEGTRFKDTQVALRYDYETRGDFAAVRDFEARLGEERLGVVTQQKALKEQGRYIKARLRWLEATAREIALTKQALDDKDAAAHVARQWEAESERQAMLEQMRTNEEAIPRDTEKEAAAAERTYREKEAALKEQVEQLQRNAAVVGREHLEEEEAKLKAEAEKLNRTAAENEQARKDMAAKLKRRDDEEANTKKERARLKREIDRIESQSGYTPRFIVNNKTKMKLHIRAFRATRSVVNFENDIGAGQLRALYCASGFAYEMEIHLGIIQNRFIRRDQLLKAIGSIAFVAVLAVAAIVFTSGAALPAVFGAGSLVSYGTGWLKRKGKSPKEWLRNGFTSQLLEEQKPTVMFESGPLDDFSEALRYQIFAMEETRQGKMGLPLFVDAPVFLRGTTRLDIVGGTQKCSTATQRWPATGTQTDVMKYTFDENTKLMKIVQVDSFEGNKKSK